MLRTLGVWLIGAKLLFVPIVVDPFGADPFGVAKSAASRAVMYPLLLLIVGYVVLYRPRLRPGPLALAVAGFFGIAAIATAFAVDPNTALYGAHRRYLGLTSIADGVVTFAAIALFMRTRADTLIVAGGWTAAAVVNMTYATLQLRGFDPLRPADPTVSGLIGNSTSLGGYLVVSTAAVAALALILWSRSGWVVRAGSVGLAVSGAVLVASTGARAPSLALAPSAIAAVVFGWRAGAFQLRRGLVIMASAGSVLLASLFLLGPLGERFARLIGGDPSTLERSVIYQTALSAVASRPILGVGLDGLSAAYLQFRGPETARMTDVLTAGQSSTHSWFLHYLLGTGILGAAVFVAAIVLAILRSWRLAAAPGGLGPAIGGVALLAYLFQGLVTINGIVTDLLLWTALGLIASPADRGTGAVSRPARIDRAVIAGALIVGFVASTTVWSAIESDRAVRSSNLARAAGNVALAQRAGELAVARDSGRPDHWNVLGLSFSRRVPERAIQAFAGAVERAPHDPVYRLNLAAEEALTSGTVTDRRASAARHALRAIELDPYGPATLVRAAEVLLVVDRPLDALAAVQRAVELAPGEAGHLDVLSDVLAQLGRPEEAANALERMISSVPVHAATPRIDLPKDMRLRLAQLYASAGRTEASRGLIRPPSVFDVDQKCAPLAGSAQAEGGAVRPRCFRVLFASEGPLNDATVRSPQNYRYAGGPLPAGTTIDFDGGLAVTIQLPATVPPPAPRTPIEVDRVANVFGQAIPHTVGPVVP